MQNACFKIYFKNLQWGPAGRPWQRRHRFAGWPGPPSRPLPTAAAARRGGVGSAAGENLTKMYLRICKYPKLRWPWIWAKNRPGFMLVIKITYRTVCDASLRYWLRKAWTVGDPQMLDGGKHTGMEGTSLGVPAGFHQSDFKLTNKNTNQTMKMKVGLQFSIFGFQGYTHQTMLCGSWCVVFAFLKNWTRRNIDPNFECTAGVWKDSHRQCEKHTAEHRMYSTWT